MFLCLFTALLATGWEMGFEHPLAFALSMIKQMNRAIYEIQMADLQEELARVKGTDQEAEILFKIIKLEQK